MTERPILVRPELVRAILEGRKTQTRRIVKPQPPCECEYVINGAHSHALCRSIRDPHIWVPPTGKSVDHRLPCPYGKPGERLWVREQFYIDHFDYIRGPLPKARPQLDDGMLIYRADGTCCEQFGECQCGGKGATWRPSIHMPRWACRLVLEITAVRVERLQEISEEDAQAEGCWPVGEENNRVHPTCIDAFHDLWESINGPGSWDTNPWVWAIEFKKVTS